MGLLSQASGSVSFSAAAPTHAELLSMVEVIGDTDGDLSRCSWLMNPSTAAVLMRTERATGSSFCIEPMRTQRWLCNGLPVLMSTHIPEAKVILLDSNGASIFYFGQPQILVDPYSNANSISGVSTVVVSNYLDLGVTEPALVVVGSSSGSPPTTVWSTSPECKGRAFFTQSDQSNVSQFRSSEGPRLDEP